jgi:hypothetical protein
MTVETLLGASYARRSRQERAFECTVQYEKHRVVFFGCLAGSICNTKIIHRSHLRRFQVCRSSPGQLISGTSFPAKRGCLLLPSSRETCRTRHVNVALHGVHRFNALANLLRAGAEPTLRMPCPLNCSCLEVERFRVLAFAPDLAASFMVKP